MDNKDPRISTTRIICVRKRPPAARFIAWPAASSLLFLISALCLLFGAWTVFSSLGDDELQLFERFAMVAAVHGYELALVGVVFVLCRFQRANPDAIGPVILGAAFCVGAAVTLDLVSIDAPWMTLGCGAFALLCAFGKGRVLTTIGGNAGSWLWLSSIVGLVALNALWPGIMGIQRFYADSALYTQWWWAPAWMGVFIASVFIVIGIIRTDDFSGDRMRPFLQREAMRWTIALVVVACSLLHLLVLGYLHNLDVTTGEFVPLIAILAIGLVDLRRRTIGPAHLFDQFILASPIVFALCAVLGDDTGLLSNPHDGGALFVPALVMGLYSLTLVTLWYRQQRVDFMPIAFIAAATTILTWQVTPSVADLNWTALAAVFCVTLGAYGFYRKDAALIGTAGGVLCAAAFAHHDLHHQLTSHAIAPGVFWLTLSSLLLIAMMAWQPQAFARWFVRLTILVATISVLLLFARSSSALQAPLIAGCVILIAHSVILWRTADIITALPLLIPTLAIAPSIIPTHKGWLAVIAAFALLIIGTTVSYMRVRRQNSKRATDIATPTPVTVSALEPIGAI